MVVSLNGLSIVNAQSHVEVVPKHERVLAPVLLQKMVERIVKEFALSQSLATTMLVQVMKITNYHLFCILIIIIMIINIC